MKSRRAHKEHERFHVKAGEHEARVYRLVDSAAWETIGEVVQLTGGPLVGGMIYAYITQDNGRTFRHLTSYFAEEGALQDIGGNQNDSEVVKALRATLEKWRAEVAEDE